MDRFYNPPPPRSKPPSPAPQHNYYGLKKLPRNETIFVLREKYVA